MIVYNDSGVFGGHEMMTVEIANSLSKGYDVYFLNACREIREKINSSVHSVVVPAGPKWTHFGLYSYGPASLFRLKKIYEAISPDMSIVSQGMIEAGLRGMFASRISHIKTVSYIPLCQWYHKMGSIAGWMRDICGKYYFNLFDSFITVSKEQEDLIRSRLRPGTEKKIYILDNIIDVSSGDAVGSQFAGGFLRIGIIGRLDFFQKGQDKAVEIAKGMTRRSIAFKFVVIGEGKDRSRLLRQIDENRLRDNFVLKGWVDNKRQAYSDIDVVLIASNFEGVPLVLLEALQLKKIIIAPDIGIFREYLDDCFLYKNHDDAINKLADIETLKRNFNEKIYAMRKKMLDRHDPEKFKNALYKIVGELIERDDV